MAKRNRTVPVAASATRDRAKQPVEPAGQNGGETIRFSFGEFDGGGQWCLHDVSAEHVVRLMKKLKALEKSTPRDLFLNHTMSKLNMSDCPNKNAKARLAQQYEGLDVLHEIRIAPSEALRLHGRLDGRFFNIIWWDPKHQVWPQGKNVR